MKNNKHLFLDIHAIQTLPPSNINRDDTGSPKTAQYGGVRRSRVSSQSWKKAIRDYFKHNIIVDDISIRTKKLEKLILDKIMEIDKNISEEDAKKMASNSLDKLKRKTDTGQDKKIFISKPNEIGDGTLNVLFSITREQIKKIAEYSVNLKYIEENMPNKESSKKIKEMNKELRKDLAEKPSIDIALFGRMLADDPSLNEDASSQVAHAISTHAIQNEFDYFTAVDDLSTEDNAGAGMLGNIEFNSSTLYRYANVAVHELNKQLDNKESTINTLKLFIEAFTNSLPTGKVNTFANQTIPQALLITLREDRPTSLVSAFEKPIKSSDGYVQKSIEALADEYKKIEKFVDKPIKTMYVTMDNFDIMKEIGDEKNSLNELLNDFGKCIDELID